MATLWFGFMSSLLGTSRISSARHGMNLITLKPGQKMAAPSPTAKRNGASLLESAGTGSFGGPAAGARDGEIKLASSGSECGDSMRTNSRWLRLAVMPEPYAGNY